MVVARGAGAAGPVLLACRQWDPLGLARRLPSRGAGVWLGAPLLPWRLQCPARVCAALAAGLGGLLRSPSPAPRSPRCVWRVVPSRDSVPSPTGTPFHSVWVFRGSGPVALLVFPACPLCVRALALSRRPRPSSLPGSVWRAHLAWSQCRAPVGQFHAVHSPLLVLPRPPALPGLVGGGCPSPVPPRAWLGVVCPLMGGPARPGRSGAGGSGGGGAACVPSSPEAWPGGPEGLGVALPRSVPLPLLGGHQSGCYWCRSVHGGRGLHTAPIRVCVLIPGVVRLAPLSAGAGLPACLAVSVGAGEWGCGSAWRTGFAAFAPRVPRPFQGEGELPPGLGGGRGPAPPCPVSGIPRAGGGGVGGERGGGSRRGSSPPSSGGVLCGPRPWPPFMAGGVAWRIPPCCMLGRGCVAGPRAGRGPAGRWWVSLPGGGGGGLIGAPPLLGGSVGGPRGAGGRKVALLRFVSPPPPGGPQGGSLHHCLALHTALAHVRVLPSWCCPRGALACRRRAAGLLRVLREWAGG